MAMVPPAWLKYFGASLLEFFLPRMCLFCGVPVGETAAVAVCPECEARITWVASPLCTRCGRMFEDRDGPDRVCGDCQAEPPPSPGPGPRLSTKVLQSMSSRKGRYCEPSPASSSPASWLFCR
jgi:hypothetical protein